MAQVNFMKELFAFHIFAKAKSLTLAEFGLWWALFYLFNNAADGNEWPEDFLSFSNKEVLAESRFGEDTLIRARKGLVKHGIIEYKEGRKNKLCPRYKLMYLSAAREGCPQAGDNVPDSAGNGTGNIAGYIRGNIPRNPAGKAGGNSADIPINLNGTQTTHTYSGYDNAWRMSERARNAVAQRILDGWNGYIGRGYDLHGELVYYMEMGMTPQIIERVMQGCGHACLVENHLEAEAIDLGLIVDLKRSSTTGGTYAEHS